MKKKITKLAALVLAGVVIVTASVVPAVANGGVTVEPEIMFYRDFEDYTGGPVSNPDSKYGTFAFGFEPSWGWDTTKVGNGNTGIGFVPDRTAVHYGSLYQTYFPATVQNATDGKIYITFTSEDIPDVANSGNTAVAGTNGYKYFGFDHGTAYDLSGWATDTVGTAIPEPGLKNYKIDIVFDLKEKVQTTCINNVVVHNEGWTGYIDNPATSQITFWFENGVIIDNFAMVYYPENVASQTFSMESAKINDDNTISVFLKSDAVDSDGKGSSAMTAPYGISLPSTNSSAYELANDTFSIDGLTVTSVTRGTTPGEYVIAVDENIAENTNYTITAKNGLTDILGATINGNANTAAAMKGSSAEPEPEPDPETEAEPEILFYRDFEDYTGGPVSNPDSKYGTFAFGFEPSWGWDTAKVGTGTTGIGFVPERPEGYYHHGSLWQTYFPATVQNATDGKIYITFTSEDIPDVENIGSTAVAGTDGYKYFGFDHGTAYDLSGWATDNVYTALPETGLKNYKIDIVFDLKEKVQTTCINNVVVHNEGWTGYIANPATSPINFWFENGVIIDNFAMIYFPKDIHPTFSVSEVEADEKNDVFRVILSSDTVDSDGKGTVAKSAISVPYGIALPTTMVSGVGYVLGDDSFTVEGMNVTAVTRGTRPGEYILTVDGDIISGENYKISAKEGLVDILGSGLNPDAISKEIEVAPKLTAEVEVYGETPTVVFNDDISNHAEYLKGATVKNVYTGETGSATLTKAASNKAIIGGYEFVSGDEYEITLPAELRGKQGNSLSDNVVRFSLDATNSLKKLSLIDIQGNKLNLEEVNPVGIDCLDFEFAAGVVASDVTISITDESGAQFTDYTSVQADNKTSLKLNSILAQGKTYTIAISGLAKAYAITLNTESAELERLPVLFLDENNNVLESISEGDIVKVRMDFVNATDEEQHFLAAASMFSGLEQTGFKHKKITMKPVSDGGTGKHTEIFTFTVLEINGGVKLKGHMWSENDGRIAPIKLHESFE